MPITGNIETWSNIYYLEKKCSSHGDPEPGGVFPWP